MPQSHGSLRDEIDTMIFDAYQSSTAALHSAVYGEDVHFPRGSGTELQTRMIIALGECIRRLADELDAAVNPD